MTNNQDALREYFAHSLLNLPKNSEKFKKLLIKLIGESYREALYHFPTGAISRELVESIDLGLHTGQHLSFAAKVKKYVISPPNSPVPHRVIVYTQGKDGPLEISLVYFRMSSDALKNMLPMGSVRIISGKLEAFDMRLQIVHPDYVVATDRMGDLPDIQPLYPLTAGVTQRSLGKVLTDLASQIPPSGEWLYPAIIEKQGWVSFSDSLREIHIPTKAENVLPDSIYRRRLAYDRILAHQLRLSMIRQTRRKQEKRAFTGVELMKKILSHLPFALTGDQLKALEEIKEDLSDGHAMARLVQGDVGSGKTLVALCASSFVIEQGGQSAIMAPTEILAKQHYASLKPLCEKVGINIGLLTGKDTAKNVRETLAGLADGSINLLIGTHAIIQERVIFKNLALGIIDEQHRFGVEQRSILSKKGFPYAHILLMTATPIPRSLAMAQYGDTDLSIIREKPPGRKPIVTKVMPIEKFEAIVGGLKRVLSSENRAYWVCPLVEESEKMDLMAAEERFKLLEGFFPNQVGLVHGKMKTAEKDEVIEKFMLGEISLLVSTTVIEVGVNVPEATVMIIEEAERFGLSQLHQLRGRVGRGDRDSSCLLLYKGSLSKTATARLSIIRETEDGFVLSEKDLELRGAGDFLGTKQTGLLNMEGFDFLHHSDLVSMARKDARFILETDPHLNSERGKNIRTLLGIFESEREMVVA